jgi:spore coat protein U-like protein
MERRIARCCLPVCSGLIALCLSVLCAPTPVLADAAPTTGVLLATATIAPGCRVVGQMLATTTADFGSLNFGTVPSLFRTAITAQSVGPSGMVQLTCSGEVSVDVSISTGLYASGNQRQLGSGTKRVPYDLYIDSGLTNQFSGATVRTLAISPTGLTTTVNMPIYGRIQANPGAYSPGVYSDTVQITIAF